MKPTTLLLAGMVLIIIAMPAYCEYYRYKDKNGRIVFTDDISLVPPEQRETAKEYVESVSAPAMESPSDKTKSSANKSKDLREWWKSLETERSQLDKEADALMKERSMLKEERKNLATPKELEEHHVKVNLFNQKIVTYEKQKEAFEKSIVEYQDALKQRSK